VTLIAGTMFRVAAGAAGNAHGHGSGVESRGSVRGWGGYRWFSTRNMLVLQQVAASLMLLLLTGFVGFGLPQFRPRRPGL